MAGCKSCSNCSAEPSFRKPEKAQKLEKVQISGNPRYPHVFEGNQAIFTDDDSQMIVNVVEDRCDDERDCFELIPQRILKDKKAEHSTDEPFEVDQQAGEKKWRLHALI